jgi:hypothetical protein
MKLAWVIAAPLLAVTLAGCGAVGAIGFPLSGQPQETAPPQSLTPVTEQVVVTPLPPADPGYDPGPVADPLAPVTDPLAPLDPNAVPVAGDPNAQQVAALPPAGAEVGRTDLLGGWTVTSGTDTCELFMTLTAWTGGYRASTRGCQSTTLSSISAWNLENNVVILALADGTPLAHLRATAATRFEGTLDAGGVPISFFR